MPRDRSYRRNAGIALLLLAPLTSLAQQAPAGGASADELAKQLSNPVAALISVPLQLNYDEGYGADGDGERCTLNIQPVVADLAQRGLERHLAHDPADHRTRTVSPGGSELRAGRHDAEPVLLAEGADCERLDPGRAGPRSCCRRRARMRSAPSSGRSARPIVALKQTEDRLDLRRAVRTTSFRSPATTTARTSNSTVHPAVPRQGRSRQGPHGDDQPRERVTTSRATPGTFPST